MVTCEGTRENGELGSWNQDEPSLSHFGDEWHRLERSIRLAQQHAGRPVNYKAMWLTELQYYRATMQGLKLHPVSWFELYSRNARTFSGPKRPYPFIY